MALDIGVVIATFNRRSVVLDAVGSVMNQTEPPRQVILVDDGSTDDTADAIRQRFPSVVTLQQDNHGQAAARNAGIAALETEWVAFLDDDDLWHPRKLELTAAFVERNPSCVALRTPVWFFSDGASGTEMSAFGMPRDLVCATVEELVSQAELHRGSNGAIDYLRIKGASFERMLEVNRGVTSSTVIRRDLAIMAGGFPVQFRGSDDWLFFLNVARFAEWDLMEDRLSFSRIHAGQATNMAPGISLGNLGAKVAAFYGGRPISDKPEVYDPSALLAGCAAWYRSEVRGYLWSALRRRDWRNARLIRRMMPLLLPRLGDRLFCYAPPGIRRVLVIRRSRAAASTR